MLRDKEKGFTLIELMIVVAILGILAAIAMPMFANMVAQAQEGATKGNLGALRSALSIYYGDMDGFYPQSNLNLNLTPGGRFLQAIPNAYFPKTPNSPGHATTNTFTGWYGLTLFDGSTILQFVPSFDLTQGKGGGWGYDGRAESSTYGMIVPFCAHEDMHGNVWFND